MVSDHAEMGNLVGGYLRLPWKVWQKWNVCLRKKDGALNGKDQHMTQCLEHSKPAVVGGCCYYYCCCYGENQPAIY